jgi:transposase
VPTSLPVSQPEPLSKAEERARDRLDHRQARYDEVARLRQAGLPLKRIARELGLGHKTVKRWLRAGQAPTWRKPPRPKLIDRSEEHLERRWREGCHNAAQLWRELRDQGFTGKSGTVRLWATRRRHDHGQDPAAPEMALRLIL